MDQHRFERIISCKLTIDIEAQKIDCLSFVMCPLLAQLIIGIFSFLLQLFTVLMKKTRAIKQSIFLDVYEADNNIQISLL
jgi:hypothetical protein